MRLRGSDVFYKSLNLVNKPYQSFKKLFSKKFSEKELGNVLENITDHYFVLKKTSQMADELALKYSSKDYKMSLEVIEKRDMYLFESFPQRKKGKELL